MLELLKPDWTWLQDKYLLCLIGVVIGLIILVLWLAHRGKFDE